MGQDSPQASSGSSALSDILSGTMGGVAQVVVGHPLDTVKVRMQSSGSSGGFVRTFLAGLRGGTLYAGAMSPLSGAMLHNATLFYVNGAVRSFLHDPKQKNPVSDAFISGAVVGLAATIVETPIDLIKCKLQATSQYPTFLSCVRGVYGNFGIAGLWQGVGATGLRNIPCFSAYFGCNTVAKEYFTSQNNGRPLQLWQMFLGGAAAGFGFWGVLYPFDVVKSRMQVQSSVLAERKYKSVLHCFRTIYKEEGIEVFWRAYTPALIRALVVNGAVFLTFEYCKGLIANRG